MCSTQEKQLSGAQLKNKQKKDKKSVQWDNIDRMKANELQYVLRIINQVRPR